MRLLVDFGNTSAKWRLIGADGAMHPDVRELDSSFELLSAKLSTYLEVGVNLAQVEHLDVVISAVSSPNQQQNLLQVLYALERKMEFSLHAAKVEKCFAGLTVAYNDLSQLGVDRWLAMLAARRLVNAPFLLIGAGTAITVDKVSKDGLHAGGLIAPGWRLLKESLAQQTENLGVATEVSLTDSGDLGADTKECLTFGLSQMFLSFVSSAVHHFGADESVKILSGGDALALSKCSSEAFLVKDNLVLDGLALYCDEKGMAG